MSQLNRRQWLQSLAAGVVVTLDSSLPRAAGGEQPADLTLQQADEYLQIDTDALQARVRKKGYVSGLAQSTFRDRKTGAREAGFGLHIMDFLLAPGWKDDGYLRDPKRYDNLPKHYGHPKNRN